MGFSNKTDLKNPRRLFAFSFEVVYSNVWTNRDFPTAHVQLYSHHFIPHAACTASPGTSRGFPQHMSGKPWDPAPVVPTLHECNICSPRLSETVWTRSPPFRHRSVAPCCTAGILSDPLYRSVSSAVHQVSCLTHCTGLCPCRRRCPPWPTLHVYTPCCTAGALPDPLYRSMPLLYRTCPACPILHVYAPAVQKVSCLTHSTCLYPLRYSRCPAWPTLQVCAPCWTAGVLPDLLYRSVVPSVHHVSCLTHSTCPYPLLYSRCPAWPTLQVCAPCWTTLCLLYPFNRSYLGVYLVYCPTHSRGLYPCCTGVVLSDPLYRSLSHAVQQVSCLTRSTGLYPLLYSRCPAWFTSQVYTLLLPNRCPSWPTL